jgi:hypothetical protein
MRIHLDVSMIMEGNKVADPACRTPTTFPAWRIRKVLLNRAQTAAAHEGKHMGAT